MENNIAKIYIEKLNTDIVFLFKNDSAFKLFIQEVCQLTAEDLSAILINLESSDYISKVIKLIIKYKLGKIKDFKYELSEVCNYLFKRKKYSRILQIKTILEQLKIDISNYNDFESRVLLRMNGEKFENYHEDSEFNDVINNANIFLANDESKSIFFKKAEVFPLVKFLEGIFKSFVGDLKSNTFLDTVEQLYKYSGEERIKNIIEEVYRDKKITQTKKQRIIINKEVASGIQVDHVLIPNLSIDKNEVIQKIYDLKEDLYSENINKEHFVFLLHELIFCYQKLEDKTSENKLKEYLLLKTRGIG